jgi:hypothetical protein
MIIRIASAADLVLISDFDQAGSFVIQTNKNTAQRLASRLSRQITGQWPGETARIFVK